MASKKTGKELAVVKSEEYAVLMVEDPQAMAVQLREMGVTRFELTKVTVPLGGAIAFELKSLRGVSYEQEIEVVIAFQQPNQRTWYAIPLDESGGGTKVPPNCTSSDGIHGLGINDPDADLGGPDEHHDCATCRWNKFGSTRGREGGKAKDCSEHILFYCFGKESRMPFIVQVPARSLKFARQYAVELMGEGLTVNNVVTKLSLHKEESPFPHAVIDFDYVGDLDADARKRMGGIADDMRATFVPVVPFGNQGARDADVDIE